MGKVYIKAQQQYFKPEDKQVYFTKSVTYTKIGFDQLVKHVAADSGMSEGACEGAVRSIIKFLTILRCISIISITFAQNQLKFNDYV